jgi:NAD(P)-dependent dehydrogenase (short-subunit alcohol dehydrogenase family)
VSVDAGGVAVVTGAGGSIGAAIVERFARDGWTVVAADRDVARADAVRSRVGSEGPELVTRELDVTDEDALTALFAELPTTLGRPADLVVANAGVQTFSPFADLTESDWRRVLEINAWGTFATVRAACESWRSADRAGAVVAMASIQGYLANVTSPHYAASKAAVMSIVRSSAKEYAADGTRVNAVAPGMVDSALWDALDREVAAMTGVEPGTPRAERIARIPLGRPARPEDVAGVVAFLASDDAAYVTGECIAVSGGDLLG